MNTREPAAILLVDDEPANLLALEAVLHDLGEPLVATRSGEEAMRALRDGDFAAVLLDVHMPGMDGFETGRLIRAQKRSRETPILFITADASDMSAQEAYALGAVDFLSKPLKPQVLKAKLAFFIELHRSRAELQAAERQAVQDRVFLSAVLEAVEDGIVACDASGQPTLFNRATRDFFGLNFDSLSAQGWPPNGVLRHTDGHPLPPDQTPLARAMKGHEVRNEELVIAVPGRPPRAVLASGQALRDESGTNIGAVVSLHDISARREATSAREAAASEQRRREEAEAVARLLRESREQLAESDRRKTEFLATLAHELRNPLAPISNGLHLMRMAPDDPSALEGVRAMMQRQLNHLVHLVDDLLDIARISRDKVELRKEQLDLHAVLASAVETSLPLIEEGRHTLVQAISPEPLPLHGDATRIAQVVSNLLNNAARYTLPGGRIELGARREGGDAVLWVADSGMGIAAGDLPNVFEMFTQVGRNRQHSQGGLGIGLALVKRLVALHGGSVDAQSPGPGGGSTFTVRLPLSGATQPTAHADATRTEGEEEHAPFRILVVDDNVDAAVSLATLLEMQGNATQVAHGGDEALRVAADFRPQIVFLDIGMPGKDGYQVARELRASEHGRQAVLVALTGWGAQEDRKRARDAGFDHHLTKPAGLPDVEALLAQLARTRIGPAVAQG